MRYAALPEVFAESDVVTLHVPSAADARPLVDGDLLRVMRPQTVIINTARAQLDPAGRLVRSASRRAPRRRRTRRGGSGVREWADAADAGQRRLHAPHRVQHPGGSRHADRHRHRERGALPGRRARERREPRSAAGLLRPHRLSNANEKGTQMQLTSLERDMLEGKHGPGVALAMKVQVGTGKAFYAERMVPITRAHVASSAQEGDLYFVTKLVDLGAHCLVSPTTNPSMDLRYVEGHLGPFPEDVSREGERQ